MSILNGGEKAIEMINDMIVTTSETIRDVYVEGYEICLMNPLNKESIIIIVEDGEFTATVFE